MAASRVVDTRRDRNSIFEGEASLLFRRWGSQTYYFKIFMKENTVRVARL
jgi:hypothetical protein